MMDHSSLILPALTASAAALSVVALTALQTDLVSRRILAADRLKDKRHAEYAYRWTQALEKAKLQLQFFFAGGTTDTNLARDEELVNTTFLEKEEEIRAFIKTITAIDKRKLQQPQDSSQTVRIGRIGTDLRMTKSANNELYVWLYQGASNIYQVPLRSFGTLLADAMDRQITSSAFCFVSDASAGVASQLVVDLVKATKTTSVCMIQEPLWMVYFAAIAQQQSETMVLSRAVLQRILFGLCRLDALHHQGTGFPEQQQSSTILVTLPGQATTTVLLPLLQAAFPDDRHVFSYAGCVKTVEYALIRRYAHPRAKVPASQSEALRFTDPTAYTTPLSFSLHKSANVVSSKFLPAMSDMPLHHADTVESWMGTVDAFLNLKEDEKTNGYLPYVLRLDYLLSDGSLDKNSDRYWTMLSLLQYVTGSRTREMPSEQVDAASSWLQDYREPTSSSSLVSSQQKRAISNAVFQHKRILIENKTLLDTVQPQQHWTLKGAVRAGGCACCAPEEDDEEEDTTKTNDDIGALAGKMRAFGTREEASTKSASAAPAVMSTGYVDGKTMFAFDPTRFSNMAM